MKKQKIFWQPEISQLIIFWSVALGIIFYGLILALENTAPYLTSNLVMGIGIISFFLGFHRYMLVDKNMLVIYYARFWKKKAIPLEKIQKVIINQPQIIIEGDFGVFECRLSKKMCERLQTHIPDVNIES